MLGDEVAWVAGAVNPGCGHLPHGANDEGGSTRLRSSHHTGQIATEVPVLPRSMGVSPALRVDDRGMDRTETRTAARRTCQDRTAHDGALPTPVVTQSRARAAGLA